jgi:hypothetical protein
MLCVLSVTWLASSVASAACYVPVACEDAEHDVLMLLGEQTEFGSPLIGTYCVECSVFNYCEDSCPDCHQIGDRHGFNCQLTWL